MTGSRLSVALRPLAVTAVAALALVVAGGAQPSPTKHAASTPTRGGTLRIADTSEAIDLNPFIAGDNSSEHVFAQIVEPLFRTGSQGQIVPWLATALKPSNGNRTWTVTLRKGVKFSNGKPMTAADVAFSLNQVRKSPNWAAMFAPVATVRAASASSVVITTKKPFGVMEATLSLPFAAIVPANYGGVSAKKFDQHPVGTGPFTLAAWDHGRTLTLARNPHYWKPSRPYLDKVVFKVVSNSNSRVLQLRAKQLDVAATPPWAQLSTLAKTPGITVGKFALSYPDMLMFNEKDPLFANAQVRHAAALAVNRSSVIRAALAGNGSPGGSWYAPSLEFFDKSIKPEENPSKAKQLLASALKSKGLKPAFTMKVAAGDDYARLTSQIIQASLNAVGFKMTIQTVDANSLYAQLAAGKYQSSLFGITSDIVDPSEIQGFYLGLDSFWTFAPKAATQKVFDQALATLDAKKRAQLYAKLQQMVATENNLVVLDYRPWVWAMRDNVTGFDLAPTGVPWLADVGFSS
jgi:peptide/nickel transport system substrate-binding protein